MSQTDLYETDRVNDIFVIRPLNEEMLLSELIPTRQDELVQLIGSSDAPRVVLDLANIAYMSSTALGLLVTLHKRLAEQSRTFAVCSPQRDIRLVLEITMFHKLFPIYDSLSAALTAE